MAPVKPGPFCAGAELRDGIGTYTLYTPITFLKIKKFCFSPLHRLSFNLGFHSFIVWTLYKVDGIVLSSFKIK
jgi:hypothetical protein